MPTKVVNVNDYISRLEELGGQEDHIGRFYVALQHEVLLDLEEQLTQSDKGLALYQPILNLYNRWKAEIGSAKWAEVWKYNESLGDADRNWLLSEAMDDSVDLAAR